MMKLPLYNLYDPPSKELNSQIKAENLDNQHDKRNSQIQAKENRKIFKNFHFKTYKSHLKRKWN